MSEGSSGGASDDDFKRRSGSSDQNLSGGQSPEHSAYSRESVVSGWVGLIVLVSLGVGLLLSVTYTMYT